MGDIRVDEKRKPQRLRKEVADRNKYIEQLEAKCTALIAKYEPDAAPEALEEQHKRERGE